MRWMGHPRLLDGEDQLEQGYAEYANACDSTAPVPVGIGQVTTG